MSPVGETPDQAQTKRMADHHEHHDDPVYLLSQYLDGTLDPAARRELEKRLVADPALARQLAELRQVDQWVRDWGEGVPSLDFERFAEQVCQGRRQIDRQRRSRRYLLYAGAPLAAAAAVVIAVSVFMFEPSTATRPSAIAMVAVDRPQLVDGDQAAGSVARVSFDRREPAAEAMRIVPTSSVAVAFVGGGDAALASTAEPDPWF